MRWLYAALLGGALLPVTGVARAQQGGEAAAAASELFRQGRQALLDHRFDVACPQLAESQRLDPKVGTLISLAQCEEGAGKLALALRRWDDAQALAQQTSDRRADYVAQQRATLAPRVPQLALHVPAGEGVRVVVNDGASLSDAEMRAPVPVDPGAHTVTVTQPGHADAAFPVRATEGATVNVPLNVGPPVAAPAAATDGATTTPIQWGGTQHILAYVAGGLGVVSIGVASAFAAQAISARNDPNCSNGVCSTQADAQTQHNGVIAGNVATGLFIAGGALIAGGVVIWLTAPRTTDASARTASTRASPWLRVAPGPGGGLLSAGSSW